jgi:hypothetical protein
MPIRFAVHAARAIQNKSDGTFEPLRIGTGKFSCVFEVVVNARGTARIAICQVDSGANAPAVAAGALGGGSSFSVCAGEEEGEFCLFDRASGIWCALRVLAEVDFHEHCGMSVATTVTLSDCFVYDAEHSKMRCVVAELSVCAGDADVTAAGWTRLDTCLPTDPTRAITNEHRTRASNLLHNAFRVRRPSTPSQTGNV